MPRDYTQFFREADTDNSGTLTVGELIGAIRRAGFRGSDAELKNMFRSADASGDGILTLDEFLAAMGEVPPQKQKVAHVRSIFNAFDKDGSGTIDKSEVKEIWREIGRTLGEEELKRVMAMLDGDGDGVIDYEEFLKFYEK